MNKYAKEMNEYYGDDDLWTSIARYGNEGGQLLAAAVMWAYGLGSMPHSSWSWSYMRDFGLLAASEG